MEFVSIALMLAQRLKKVKGTDLVMIYHGEDIYGVGGVKSDVEKDGGKRWISFSLVATIGYRLAPPPFVEENTFGAFFSSKRRSEGYA